MIQKIKAAFLAFMRGRYGMDTLNTVMLWCSVGLAVINIFVKSTVLYLIQTALLVCMILRLMSRNYVNELLARKKQILQRFVSMDRL